MKTFILIFVLFFSCGIVYSQDKNDDFSPVWDSCFLTLSEVDQTLENLIFYFVESEEEVTFFLAKMLSSEKSEDKLKIILQCTQRIEGDSLIFVPDPKPSKEAEELYKFLSGLEILPEDWQESLCKFLLWWDYEF